MNGPQIQTRQQRDLNPGAVRSFRRDESGAAFVDVVFSKFADVKRYSWDGEFLERLSPDGMVLDRLNAGAAVLKDHRANSDSQIGVVVAGSAKVENGEAIATVRFSSAAANADFVRDVEEGVRRNISFGYNYLEYHWDRSETEGLVLNVKRYEALEISFVPIGADAGASTRTTPEVTMPPDLKKERLRAASIARVFGEVCRAHSLQETHLQSVLDAALDEGISAEDAKRRFEERAAALSSSAALTPAQAQLAERSRVSAILDASKRMGLGHEFAESLIAAGTPLDQARAQIIEAAAARSDKHGISGATGPNAQLGTEESEKVRGALEDALLHRAKPDWFPLKDRNDYRGMTLLEIGKDLLQRNGHSVRGLVPAEIAPLMLRAGTHGTSDFPSILGNVTNKLLRRAYDEEGRRWLPIVSIIENKDFKQISRVQISEAPDLKLIPEGAQITYGTFGESKETYQIASYGRIVPFTRQMIINDDLAAFARLPRLYGSAAARLESDIVMAQITSNPTMGDGLALFHADHANIADESATPSLAALGKAMAQMQLQTGINGAPLNIEPFAIICPVVQRRTWQTLLAHIDHAAASNTATPEERSLIIVSDSRLDKHSQTKWYLAANPNQIDTIEVAYLEGFRGPRVSDDEAFDRQGISFKVEHDFAAKVMDHRAFVLNEGETESE